ncbi:MAG: hypothetical protein AAB646_00465 [Patescibacteria group bacterium]
MSWFQSHKEQIIKTVLVVLLATLSFGLGYLIRGEIKKAPIIIDKNSQ